MLRKADRRETLLARGLNVAFVVILAGLNTLMLMEKMLDWERAI